MNVAEETNEHFHSPADNRMVDVYQAVALRCLRCEAPVPNAVCGRKSPCPDCGFPYPLGDCSDLAEN